MFEKSVTFASRYSRNSALPNGHISLWLKCMLLASFLVSLGSSIAAQVSQTKMETNAVVSISTAWAFDANLLHAMLLEDPKSNLVVSPLNLKAASGLLGEGAKVGSTPAIGKPLNFGKSYRDLQFDELNESVTTAVVTTSRSAHADQKVIFNVNRPFMASLIDQSTGTHLAWVIVNHF